MLRASNVRATQPACGYAAHSVRSAAAHTRNEMKLPSEPRSTEPATNSPFDTPAHQWFSQESGRSANGAQTPKTQAGPYRLNEVIGRGGTSTVYRGRRDDGTYDAAVAVKVLDVRSELFEELFSKERQVLATLDHPSIARLIDAGTTSNGQPFIAMELVEGTTLDTYCLVGRLSTAAILELFLAICRAVSFAHQRLIVHRDLKPSNILVERSGTPKLLDFGISKVLRAGSREDNITVGTRALTPNYASPEQLFLRPINTTTDVYALGVILYQLLTGRLPRSVEALDLDQVKVVMAARVPVLSEVDEPAYRDLGAVVQKALEGEESERYQSVEDLAADLERVMDSRPVTALKSTLSYRARKFVRRNKLSIGITTAAVAATAAFIFVSLTQQATVVRQRDELAQKNEELTRQQVSAETSAEFLTSLFELADPYQTPRADFSADTVLTQATERLTSNTDLDPRVRAGHFHTLAEVRQRLNHNDEALQAAKEAEKIRREFVGTDPLALAETLEFQARWFGSEGESVLKEVIALRRRELGDTHVLVADGWLNLGHKQHYQGRIESAEQTVLEARTVLDGLNEPYLEGEHSYHNLLGVQLARKDQARAVPPLREALRLSRLIYGDRNPQVGQALGNLGYTLLEIGEIDEAISMLEESTQIRRESLGDEHPELGVSLNNFALALSKAGKPVEAVVRLTETVELWAEQAGWDSWALAFSNRAQIKIQAGDVRGARADYQALAIEALEIENTFWQVVALEGLGRLELLDGRRPQAKEGYLKAANTCTKRIQDEIPSNVRIRSDCGMAFWGLGYLSGNSNRESASKFAEALEISSSEGVNIQRMLQLRAITNLALEQWDAFRALVSELEPSRKQGAYPMALLLEGLPSDIRETLEALALPGVSDSP